MTYADGKQIVGGDPRTAAGNLCDGTEECPVVVAVDFGTHGSALAYRDSQETTRDDRLAVGGSGERGLGHAGTHCLGS